MLAHLKNRLKFREISPLDILKEGGCSNEPWIIVSVEGKLENNEQPIWKTNYMQWFSIITQFITQLSQYTVRFNFLLSQAYYNTHNILLIFRDKNLPSTDVMIILFNSVMLNRFKIKAYLNLNLSLTGAESTARSQRNSLLGGQC